MDQNLDIFEQVFHSVVKEYWDGREHDVLGCQACFNVGGYCRKSCYNVLHPVRNMGNFNLLQPMF